MKGLLSILISIIVIFGLEAQQVKIITSGADGKPIPFVHICTQELPDGEKDYNATDRKGLIRIDINKQSVIIVSNIGYETIIDTLGPGLKEKEYIMMQSNYDIDEVVVTGQHKITSVDKSIYDIKLIGKTDIENRAANNLADLLSNELNIRLSHDPSTGTGMFLQGLDGENVKILMDGVPIIGRLNGNIDLSQIDLENVDHIEIIEGPMSVIYGSNALAGVINIISKENKYADFKLNLHTYYESVGVYNTNANISLKKNKHTIELLGGRKFFEGYALDENSRRMDYKPKELYNAALSYIYRGTNTWLRFKTDYFIESLLDRSEAFPSPYFDRGFDIWNYTHRYNNNLSLKQKISNYSDFDFLASYSFYDRQKLTYIKDLTDLTTQLTQDSLAHDTSAFNNLLFRGIYNYHPEKIFSLQAGIDLNYENGTGKRILNNKQEIGDYAVFASVQIVPFRNFSVQPGLRYAYNTKYKAPLVPSMNLRYQILKTNLRLSYSRGFRAPSLKELYLHFYDSNHEIEGNDSLKAEYSHSFNFSIKRKFRKNKHSFSPGFKVYYNIIENMIELVPVNPDNPLHYRNENIGHFESVGFEASLGYNLNPYFMIDVAYSKGGRKSDVYLIDEFKFSNNFNTRFSVNFWNNSAKVAVIYKFTGEYPLTYSDNIMSRFHSADMTLSKKLWKSRINISGGVKNFFDNIRILDTGGGGHGSSEVASFVGWGRTFYLDLKINISKY